MPGLQYPSSSHCFRSKWAEGYSFGEDCLHDCRCLLPHVLIFAFIRHDGGAADEEVGGAFVDEGEDAIFGLLSKGVVVGGGEGLDDEVLDLIHELWRYLRIIIILGKKQVNLGERENGKRFNI